MALVDTGAKRSLVYTKSEQFPSLSADTDGQMM